MASLEISFYPLEENYKEIILDFINSIKKNEKLEVEVNSFSTQIFGDYDEIMKLLSTELKEVLSRQPSIAVMKLSARDLR
ncbi:MAG: YkoF family thiamine/hydroxymethylpyrimidine-binding protein [Bacteroidia bacterium]